ncbi:MAG: GSU2203 family decaheme c-type cytochrome [Dissulfurimicrobium sp.]|uniref:GSU2203 family decaheme c-type cytochrome n=1 Tax=Dissulfurimicrobium TaxID=1769732 RepID=UPI001EDA7AAA|nr:GSU2203 family decaheme c-type cytochrome [Dissulfurimicrobium hydrothermale]UKL14091.1 DmsE family decaheme c-type cytochrome [Dissulfurimicrobium hydrothermale]
MHKKILFVVVGLGFIMGCTGGLQKRSAVIKTPKPVPEAVYVGTETCRGCHEGLVAEKENVHMRIASFEVPDGYKTGCESCHGPGSVHIESGGDPTKILGPKKDKNDSNPEGVAGICVSCHQNGSCMNWPGSTHQENGVHCTSCHKIHSNSKKSFLIKDEKELCASCHQDVNAQTYFASHHPIKEGKMGCTDCHNPHGGENMEKGMLRTDERVNDLCLKCHTRYQGPFVFEHDPVVENCLICHEPHGSVANNLLRQQEPFLCLQCHEAHFHAARASNSQFPVTVPGDPTNQIAATDRGFQKSFMTKCTQCHPRVHGSDMPSQSVAGQGKGLTR